METEQGASNNERMLSAAKGDDLELLEEVFEEGDFQINFSDGLGNTALHYAAKMGSTEVIEAILEQDDCDVDPVNKIDKQTPLHLATKILDAETRYSVLSSLLEAGADMTVKDKYGSLAVDLLPGGDETCKALFRKTEGQAAIGADDIAEDSDDGTGSGSDG